MALKLIADLRLDAPLLATLIVDLLVPRCGREGRQGEEGRSEVQGGGVAQSYEKAAKWYQKAADQGVAKAQYNLGNCYRLGQGVAQSYEKAAKWYQKAADQGDAEENVCYPIKKLMVAWLPHLLILPSWRTWKLCTACVGGIAHQECLVVF